MEITDELLIRIEHQEILVGFQIIQENQADPQIRGQEWFMGALVPRQEEALTAVIHEVIIHPQFADLHQQIHAVIIQIAVGHQAQ